MKKKIVIFGVGYYGRNAFRVSKYKNYKTIFFVDNNFKYLKKKIMGTKVYSPKVLKKDHRNFNYIILTGRHIDEMRSQLLKFKIDKKKILTWGKKDLKLKKKYFTQRSKDIYNSLKKLVSYFKKYKINFWLDHGSLLFVTRKQDLADTYDVDLILNVKDLSKLERICKQICYKYKNYYYKTQLYHSCLLKKKIKKIVLFKTSGKNKNYEPAIFEFNLLVNKNKKFENLAKNKIFSKNFWKKKIFLKYKEIFLPVPFCHTKYLNIVYGDNWKTKLNFYKIS